jgi:hypothetical protein
MDPLTLGALAGLVKASEPVLTKALSMVESATGAVWSVSRPLLDDAIYRHRVRNRIRFMIEEWVPAQERLVAAGIDPRNLAAEFSLPLLRGTEMVEDPELKKMWANLVAAGLRDPEYQRPILVHRLQDLSATDARAFVAACDAADGLGMKGPLSADQRVYWSVTPTTPAEACLEALGLIEWHHPKADIKKKVAIPSHLGWFFRAAVLRAGVPAT